nr:uncharacterized protein LOC111511394 [Leptinotarsa decemlineata]
MNTVSQEPFKVHLWESIRAVKLLQILSVSLGLSIPNLYVYEGLSIFYVIYSVLLCLVQTVTLIFNIVITTGNQYHLQPLSTNILHTVALFLSTATNIISIIMTVTLKRRKMVKLAKTISTLEKQMQLKYQETIIYDNNKLITKFLLFQSFIIGINLHQLYIYSGLFNSSFWHVAVYCLSKSDVMSISIIVSQVYFYCSCIKRIIQFTHENMVKKIRPVKSTNFVDHELKDIFRIETDFFVKKYDMICDITDMVGDIFDTQIFFILICIVIEVLHGINNSLRVILGSQIFEPNSVSLIVISGFNILQYIPLFKVYYQHYLFMITFFMHSVSSYHFIAKKQLMKQENLLKLPESWHTISKTPVLEVNQQHYLLIMAIFQTFGVILALSCQETANEARKTSNICYKLLLDFPSHSKNSQEIIIEEDLKLLIEHVRIRKVQFWAGTFPVDSSMLFMITVIILTLLLIILQLEYKI